MSKTQSANGIPYEEEIDSTGTPIFDNSTASGTLTLINDTVTLAIGNKSAIGIQLAGGAGGTIVFKASQDGGQTYALVSAWQEGVAGGVAPSSTANGNGSYIFTAGGYDHFQVTASGAPGTPYAVNLIGTNAIKHIGIPSVGGQGDTAATWYSATASLLAHFKLLLAATVGAGSHTYGYTNGNLTTDAWTLFGTTRTKTYTYTAGVLTSESDWV